MRDTFICAVQEEWHQIEYLLLHTKPFFDFTNVLSKTWDVIYFPRIKKVERLFLQRNIIIRIIHDTAYFHLLFPSSTVGLEQI